MVEHFTTSSEKEVELDQRGRAWQKTKRMAPDVKGASLLLFTSENALFNDYWS